MLAKATPAQLFDAGKLLVFRIRIRARLGSATERGCSSCWDGQLQEDRTLDKEFA